MEVDFVEAWVAMVVKAADDVGVRAAGREHGVKAKLDVGRELGCFAAGSPTLQVALPHCA